MTPSAVRTNAGSPPTPPSAATLPPSSAPAPPTQAA
eukprot:COSAG04_NODE_5922_length_1455_cov_1.556047_1_plen_35_part_10